MTGLTAVRLLTRFSQAFGPQEGFSSNTLFPRLSLATFPLLSIMENSCFHEITDEMTAEVSVLTF